MADEILQSVARTFIIVETLAQHGTLGVRELHTITGIGVSTVHRMLSTLVQLGYVHKNQSTDRYELTYKVLVLGQMVRHHNTAVQHARPLLEELSAKTGQTVHFAQRFGSNIRYIDKVIPSTGVVVMSSYLGMELPMYSTAVGKAMMADLSDEEVEAIWKESNVITFTEHTITTLKELKEQLENIKNTGIAYDHQEREYGISCVAVDILDVSKKPTYAVSISGADQTMVEHCAEYIVFLQELKQKLTNLIGYSIHSQETQS